MGFGFLKEIFSLAEDLHDIFKEGSQELREICTDGFREIVIKGNIDYKTSFEKQEEASSIISSSESKLNNKIQEVIFYCKETENIIKDHFENKIRLAQNICKISKETMERFLKYDINNHIIEEPVLKSVENVSTRVFTSTITSIGALGIGGTGLIFGNIYGSIKQAKRVQAANGYLEDAIDFRVKVDYEIENLNKTKSKMQYIRKLIEDEKSILSKLISKLIVLEKQLNYYIGKENVTKEEAEKAEELFKIAEMLYNLVDTKFIDSNLKVTKNYEYYLNKLKSEIVAR